MGQLFTNNPQSGTLAKAFTSLGSIAANAGRTEASIGNPNSNCHLLVSFGAPGAVGALAGTHVIEAGDELDFSGSPGRLTGPLFVRASADGAQFTFEEAAAAQSGITLS